MCRWIRIFCALSMLGAGLVAWSPTARAAVSLTRLTELQGRCVILERADGRWLLVRILRVEPKRIVVELEDGNRGVVRPSTIARARPAWRGRPRGPFPHPTTGHKATAKPRKLRVEWIGARAGLGLWDDGDWERTPFRLAGFGEVILFTLHWRHFYWEIARIGGGVPQYFHWGTALGYPFHLDDRGRHELRLGLHLSFLWGYDPSMSGVQLYYLYRPSRRFGFQIGLMQTSFPFSILFTVGISM